MDRGELVESGSHEELMTNSAGLYVIGMCGQEVDRGGED
jgi:ABC-type multidrug transport system fused ATPase/permease subunit